MFARSSDSPKIKERLDREGITGLYHFTSVENLPCIKKSRSLWSKQLLELNGEWPCPSPGGNDLSHNLDKTMGNWDKVSLNFTPHTPMAYYKKDETHLCFFVISTEVAGWEGVVFTDSNAASLNQKRGSGIEGLNLVNFEMVRTTPLPWDPDWKPLAQAEVLVPNTIPLDFVSNVVFVSKASMKEGERLWGDSSHPPFIIDRVPFEDYPGKFEKAGFTYLDDFILTNLPVDKDTPLQKIGHITNFKRQSCKHVTAIVILEALAGTKATIHWDPAGIVQETKFDTSERWRWWPHVDIDKLDDGPCSVEVKLNNVRWLKTEFEVSS